jgi:hypothetical protein
LIDVLPERVSPPDPPATFSMSAWTLSPSFARPSFGLPSNVTLTPPGDV